VVQGCFTASVSPGKTFVGTTNERIVVVGGALAVDTVVAVGNRDLSDFLQLKDTSFMVSRSTYA